MNNFDEVEKLWLEFYESHFPSELVGEKVEGICVTSLDTFTAGCIDAFISKKGRLDKQRKSVLGKSQNELKIVVDNLDGETKIYFEKLLDITNKIIQIIENRKS